MIDGDEISDVKLIRLLRSFGSVGAEEPGTLSPDPWHFSLCANSMDREEKGDAAPTTTSPMPLDCCGARGACQQSPILHSSNTRLPARPAFGKEQREDRHTTALAVLWRAYPAFVLSWRRHFALGSHAGCPRHASARCSSSQACGIVPEPTDRKNGDAPTGLLSHAIGPKRKMPGVWGQSPQSIPKITSV